MPRGSAWIWFGVLLLAAGCAAGSSQEKAALVTAAPGLDPARVDPRACILGSVERYVALETWSADVSQELETQIAKQQQCAKLSALGKPLSIEYAAVSGGQWQAELYADGEAACSIGKCVLQGLARWRVPVEPELIRDLPAWRRGIRALFHLNEAGKISFDDSASWPEGAEACDAKSMHAKLPKEVIQTLVRKEFPAFRKCYEAGLRKSPSLAGLVTVRFEIGEKGQVTAADLFNNSLPDCAVADCIVAGFRGLHFPPLEGEGTLKVGYPIRLYPD